MPIERHQNQPPHFRPHVEKVVKGPGQINHDIESAVGNYLDAQRYTASSSRALS